MPNNTTNFEYILPLVNNATDADLWGGYLNTNWEDIDADLPKTGSAKTGAFTVADDEFNYFYQMDASTAACTATLPDPTNVFNGFTVSFKASDVTNTVTIEGDDTGDLIDGAASITLDEQYDAVELVWNGTEWSKLATPAPEVVPDPFSTALFHIRDVKAVNTSSGALQTASYGNRDLNTEVTNEISGASLDTSANTFDLPSGTFFISAQAPCYNASASKAKLYNVSDSADVIIGSSVFTGPSAGVTTYSLIEGRFSCTATKTFAIQQRAGTGGVNSGGNPSNLGEDEVYTDARIWKVE